MKVGPLNFAPFDRKGLILPDELEAFPQGETARHLNRPPPPTLRNMVLYINRLRDFIDLKYISKVFSLVQFCSVEPMGLLQRKSK